MARRGRETTKPAASTASFIHSGPEAINRVDDEIAKQAKKRAAASQGNIFNFYMKPGETKQYAVLDDQPSCFIYEHTLKHPQTGKFSLVKTCAKGIDNCPACEEVQEGTYVMKLTILDFTEYVDKKGVTHEFSRKMMTVKPTQQKKFLRRLAKEGTLRGAVFEASRDGDKDAAIGNDVEFIEFMSEEELASDYMNSWTDRDGKEHTQNLAEPYVYADVIEPPDVEELRVLVGGSPAPGSRAHDKEVMDDDGWEEDVKAEEGKWEDDGEKEEKQEAKPEARRSRRGSPRSKEVEKETDPLPEQSTPRRRSRR